MGPHAYDAVLPAVHEPVSTECVPGTSPAPFYPAALQDASSLKHAAAVPGHQVLPEWQAAPSLAQQQAMSLYMQLVQQQAMLRAQALQQQQLLQVQQALMQQQQQQLQQTQQPQLQQPQPPQQQPCSAQPSPTTENVSGTRTTRTRGRRGGAKRKPQQERQAGDEKRVDPTNGRRYTQREFLMRHAVGADFSKGDQLWEAAAVTVKPVPKPKVRPAPAARVLRVRFCDRTDVAPTPEAVAADSETAPPVFPEPAKSALKSRRCEVPALSRKSSADP